jgi:hypothetical protein
MTQIDVGSVREHASPYRHMHGHDYIVNYRATRLAREAQKGVVKVMDIE